ncbi:MAG: glycosyltransferase family 61 protein [Bacteroidetes bacterium]|nr:glycosyltransferase family 61 protein [Bacteroidota bacterium]
MQLISPQTVTYRFPANDAAVADRWYAGQGMLGQPHTLPAVQLHSYRNAWVNPFGVAFAKHRLLAPSVYPMHARDGHTGQFRKSYAKNRLLRRVGQRAARVALVQHPWMANYYHFCCEVLPRLFVLREHLRDCTLLLPASERRPFHDAYLSLFDLGEVRWVDPARLYPVQELLVPDFTNGYGYHNPAVFISMQQFLLEKLLPRDHHTYGERIYISRAKAPKRKILNEAALWERLSGQGFVQVWAEDLSVFQQAAVFHQARVVAGLNGAAWSNLLYMRPDSWLLNLVHARHPEFVFYTLSSILDIRALHVPCEGDGTGRYAGTEDVNAPVDAVCELLQTHTPHFA